MNRPRLLPSLLPFLLLPALLSPAAGDDFERILHLGMDDLTREARLVLERRHPGEDWEAHDFPSFVFTGEATETGYRIAAVEPELLTPFRCYCFCDAMGHASLLWCFLREGIREKGYDEHGSTCNICYGQAMMVLLWDEAGVPVERMKAGFETKFEKLIEKMGR